MEGVPAAEVRDEMIANAARRDALQARLVATDELPPLLHPGMAALYRKQVESLAEALARPESRSGAAEALRGLVDRIVLVPDGDTLRIELKGNLAAMLATAQKTKRPPETGDLFEQVALVAGGRNRRYLELWNGAA